MMGPKALLLRVLVHLSFTAFGCSHQVTIGLSTPRTFSTGTGPK